MKKRNGFTIMMRLIGLVRPLTGYMILAVFMGLLGHLCASFITIFGVFAIQNVLNGTNNLSALFICVCMFALFRGILRYAEQTCNHLIAFKLLALIREKVFRALRRLCPAKLEGKDKGNLITVITSDIELLEVFYAHTISPAAIALLFCTILCLFIGSFHPLLALIALIAYITVGLILPLFISKISGDDGIRYRTKAGDLSSFVLDSLRGLNETIQYGQGEKRLAEITRQSRAIAEDEKRMKLLAGKNTAITNTVILLFDLIMLFASAFLFANGSIGVNGVLVSTIAFMSSFGPCVALANLGSTLQNTFAAGNRVLDLLDEAPLVTDITEQEEISFDGASVENVTFAYNQEIILDHVSLTIPKGSIIGITGRSGSGKSTLLKLFMRFWEVENGSIDISGKSVNAINTTNLRDLESFVTQDTHLFHDSIRNNLKIAKLDASEEEIIAACKKASIHDFIMTLPKGYDTPVGELGDTLSGGERQRLGLARAFLHDAPFMLLDEPTSNLDSLNEAVILKSLHQEHGDKTVVLVSHRTSTMGIAEKVYSVEHGRMS
ncbi:MAG: amino acid ABC transporter ATP-binding/permease protein [Brotaphodocola sp.]